MNCAGMYNKYADVIYLVRKYSIVVIWVLQNIKYK